MLLRDGVGGFCIDRQTIKDSCNAKKPGYSFNQMGKWSESQEKKITQCTEICQKILEDVELRRRDDYLLSILAERIKTIEKGRLITSNKRRVVVQLDRNKIIIPIQPGMSQAEIIKKLFDSTILIRLEKYQSQINSQPKKENRFPISFTRVVSNFKDLINGIGVLSDSDETDELSSPRSELSSPREEPVSPLDRLSPRGVFSPRDLFYQTQEAPPKKPTLDKQTILTPVARGNFGYSPVAGSTPSPSQSSASCFSPNVINYSPGLNDFSPTMQYMDNYFQGKFLDTPNFSQDLSFNKLQFKNLIAQRRQAMQSSSGQEVFIVQAVKDLKKDGQEWLKINEDNKEESFLRSLQKEVAKHYPNYNFGKYALFLAIRTYIEEVIIEINQRLDHKIDVKSEDSHYDVNYLRSYEKNLMENINKYFPKSIRETEMKIGEKIDKLWIRREMFIACQSQLEF